MAFIGKSNTGRRILIVEDEPMIAMLVEDFVRDLGFSPVGPAANLDEALAMAREAAFDVAILDFDLHGKSIQPVVEVVSARGVKFVLATGYNDRQLSQNFGAPVLSKPYTLDQLRSALALVGTSSEPQDNL